MITLRLRGRFGDFPAGVFPAGVYIWVIAAVLFFIGGFAVDRGRHGEHRCMLQ